MIININCLKDDRRNGKKLLFCHKDTIGGNNSPHLHVSSIIIFETKGGSHTIMHQNAVRPEPKPIVAKEIVLINQRELKITMYTTLTHIAQVKIKGIK